jgi:hypothetical protein
VTALPCKVRDPDRKGKVESGVNHAQMTPLKGKKFESLRGVNAALDRLEEKHTLFGGGIENVAIEQPGTRKRSALAHTMAAGETVASAVKAARESSNVALRAVI